MLPPAERRPDPAYLLELEAGALDPRIFQAVSFGLRRGYGELIRREQLTPGAGIVQHEALGARYCSKQVEKLRCAWSAVDHGRGARAYRFTAKGRCRCRVVASGRPRPWTQAQVLGVTAVRRA